MALETATYIHELVETNPTGPDPKSQGDDHIRLHKKVTKNTWPNITGAVTASQAELNILDGATLSTAELNVLDGVTASTAELNILDGVTATAAELNVLDGITSSTAELNILDGVTVTASDLNTVTTRALKAGDTYTGTHDFTGATLNAATPTVGDSTNKVATTAFVAATALSTALPGQTGNAGKFVTTDGTNASWAFANLVFSAESAASATIANGQHKGLRNASATTITAPASANDGEKFAVSVENGRVDNVINWNGLKHMGISDATMTIDTANVTLLFEYHGATYGWKIY